MTSLIRAKRLGTSLKKVRLTPVSRSGHVYKNSFARTAALRFLIPLSDPMARGVDEGATILADSGVLQIADGLWWLGMEQSQQACVNIAQSRFDLQLINGPIFDDYAGVSGDGASSYAETAINHSTTTGLQSSQNDIAVVGDITTSLANAGGNSHDLGNGGFRYTRGTGNALFVRVFTSTTPTAIAANAYPGLIGIDREASNIWNAYDDGVDVGGGTEVSVSPVSETFQIGKAGSAGYGVNNVRMLLIARHLTPSQHVAVYNFRQRMLTAITEATT